MAEVSRSLRSRAKRELGLASVAQAHTGLCAPTRGDIAEVAARMAACVERILRAHGRALDPALGEDAPHELTLDEPGLCACYAAAAQGILVSM